MTTEQQAREALTVLLASVRVEGHHLDRAEDARKTLIDFITQAAEDKRIADAVRGAASGEVWTNAVSGFVDEPDGTRVLILPADAVGGG